MGASGSTSAPVAENSDVLTEDVIIVVVWLAVLAIPATLLYFNTFERCGICLSDVGRRKMIEVGNCHHRFCSSCLKKHVELKLRMKAPPQCPNYHCRSQISTDACRKFLPLETYALMEQLVEDRNPDKVYCPNPKCSHPMSKKFTLATEQTRSMGLFARRCVKCSSFFCMNCKVLWHSNMSCGAYQIWESFSGSSDAKCKELARKKKWRQCPKCSHMIERVSGCKSVQCRCGHLLCYLCGESYSQYCRCH